MTSAPDKNELKQWIENRVEHASYWVNRGQENCIECGVSFADKQKELADAQAELENLDAIFAEIMEQHNAQQGETL